MGLGCFRVSFCFRRRVGDDGFLQYTSRVDGYAVTIRSLANISTLTGSRLGYYNWWDPINSKVLALYVCTLFSQERRTIKVEQSGENLAAMTFQPRVKVERFWNLRSAHEVRPERRVRIVINRMVFFLLSTIRRRFIYLLTNYNHDYSLLGFLYNQRSYLFFISR